MNEERSKHVLAFGAACLMVFAIGATILSRQFVYGVGHSERPIGAVLLLYVLAWTGFASACVWVWRTPSDTHGAVRWILAIGIAARLAMLPSGLIQENDCYRYVLDGEAVLHGVNPFRHVPEDVASDSRGSFHNALAGEDAQLILSRIGYPEIPTIYPPVAQWAFAAGAALTPWHWMGQRIVFTMADIFAMGLLLIVLLRLKKPRSWIIFYAWNPLIIKEIANAAHLESLLALSLAGLLLSCICWQAKPTRARLAWIAVALSAAILSKLYPLMLAPIVAAFVWRVTRSFKAVAGLAAGCLAIGAAAYAPFLTVGWARLTEGLREFSETWVRNAGIYELLDGMTPYARTLVAVIVVCTALGAALHTMRAAQPVPGLLAGLQWTLLVWFMTLPMAFPWYAIGLLTVCTCRPRLWALVLSGMFGIYYMIFFNDYNDMPDVCNTLTKTIEHAVVFGVLVVESFFFLVRRRDLFGLAGEAQALDRPAGRGGATGPAGGAADAGE